MSNTRCEFGSITSGMPPVLSQQETLRVSLDRCSAEWLIPLRRHNQNVDALKELRGHDMADELNARIVISALQSTRVGRVTAAGNRQVSGVQATSHGTTGREALLCLSRGIPVQARRVELPPSRNTSDTTGGTSLCIGR